MRRAAGLLNMFDKAEGFALLPRYLAAVKPAFDGLEARLAQSDGPFFSGEAPGYGDLGLFAVVNIGFWLFAAVAVSRTRAKSRKEWKYYLRGAPTLKSAVSAIVAERRLARRSLNAANNADFE